MLLLMERKFHSFTSFSMPTFSHKELGLVTHMQIPPKHKNQCPEKLIK